MRGKSHRYRSIGRLLRVDSSGSAAVELAILLPVFLTFLLGILEAGRALWTQNTLQSAAEAAARCYALNSSSCNSASATKTYAAGQAAGMTIATSEVTVSNPSCGYQVAISHTFDPVAAQLVPGLSITLNALSCHP